MKPFPFSGESTTCQLSADKVTRFIQDAPQVPRKLGMPNPFACPGDLYEFCPRYVKGLETGVTVIMSAAEQIEGSELKLNSLSLVFWKIFSNNWGTYIYHEAVQHGLGEILNKLAQEKKTMTVIRYSARDTADIGALFGKPVLSSGTR